MTPSRYILLLALLTLGACRSVVGPQTFHDTAGDTQLTGATADVRFILAHPGSNVDPQHANSDHGPNGGHYNVCAEPSPDVAKAISQAISENAQATIQGLKTLGDSASITGKQAFSLQQNSAVAELGRRLATTQLLRDGLYRLCEAFSNGAMNKYEYALVLSRYGDTMVTLLSIEALSGISANQTAAKLDWNPNPLVKDGTPPASDTAPPAKDAAKNSAGDAPKTNAHDATDTVVGSKHVGGRAPMWPPADRFAGGVMKVADHTVVQADGKRAAPGQGSKANTTAGATASRSNDGPDSLKDDAAKAVVMIQQRYLEQSRFAPFLVVCTAALSDAQMMAIPADSQRPSTIAEVCSRNMDALLRVVLQPPSMSGTAR
ncbi:hypothetical protein [Caballeronia sp. BCC1704]|uniref:hypothetical protein n=1 Tax=Caballeronia sp. BCC1704 TaxID=2676300 RepID=UPI00158CD3D7|nr:hypothetical protein [Caballeronia sp. BCC1704]